MKRSSFSILFILDAVNIVLLAVLTLLYSYDTRSRFESAAGFLILLVTAGVIWLARARFATLNRAGVVGLALGLLWLVEISINNFIAPALPERDIIDNVFWSAVTLGLLGYAIFEAYHANSFLNGVKAGMWSGFASGMIACTTALAMIVFGMGFITRDPLNVTEWAAVRQTAGHAPSMSSYFAFETFAGAMLHLVGLGAVMGVLLGVVGGLIGKAAGWLARQNRPTKNEIEAGS